MTIPKVCTDFTYTFDYGLNVDVLSVQALIIGYDVSQGIEIIAGLYGYVWNIVKLSRVPTTEQARRRMRLTNM